MISRIAPVLALAAALLAPAGASAAGAPMIAGSISAHWASLPQPTGSAEVTVQVSGARRVTASAAGKTWRLTRAGSTWTGAIHDRKVTNHIARPAFKVTIKACNGGGCTAQTMRLRNA